MQFPEAPRCRRFAISTNTNNNLSIFEESVNIINEQKI